MKWPWLAVLLPAFVFADSFPVTITIDPSKTAGPVNTVWRYFGYDEANYSYMPNGLRLLKELGELATPDQPVYVRCHHLLTSGDGVPALKWSSTNAYTEDAAGKPVYDWTVVDKIFDAYKAAGVKPYVEIGFMPEAMSTHPQDYPHTQPADTPTKVDTGQAYPPKNYGKWEELCFQWADHCAKRYGQAEAASWYWEAWNEPNINYWKAKRADYFRLYDHSVAGVRRAVPTARVGGPETAGGAGGTFMRDFLRHCESGHNDATGDLGAPLDFLSFHAKGRPKVVDGHVRMGMSYQLADMDDAFGQIEQSAKFKSLPIVIGESDPEGCAACRGPQNAYRNGTMYSSYTAASFPRAIELAERHHVNLQGALTWAFEFEDQPPFAGFRALASDGVDLPVLNVFRLWHQMRGQRISAVSSNSRSVDDILKGGVPIDHADVSAVASDDEHTVTVMIWHYGDDDVIGPDAEVTINGVGTGTAKVFRIDGSHANSYAAWLKMGSPPKLDESQREQLRRAGGLVEEKLDSPHLSVPRQGVALVVLPR